MSDDVEPPYLDARISAEWKVNIPDGTEPDDLYTANELKEAFVQQLGLNRDDIPEESIRVVVTRDVTWREK